MSTPEIRRVAADTLHQFARLIELGKIEIRAIESDYPLVRVPGAYHAPDDIEQKGPGTLTIKYITKGLPCQRAGDTREPNRRSPGCPGSFAKNSSPTSSTELDEKPRRRPVTLSTRESEALADTMEILELQSRNHTQEQIILHMTEEARKPWWRALGDTAAKMMWRSRAKGLARKNAELRWAKIEADRAMVGMFDALHDAHDFLHAMAWGTVEDMPGWVECPECRTRQKVVWAVRAPEHDMNCQLGNAVREARTAIRIATRYMHDPNEGQGRN